MGDLKDTKYLDGIWMSYRGDHMAVEQAVRRTLGAAHGFRPTDRNAIYVANLMEQLSQFRIIMVGLEVLMAFIGSLTLGIAGIGLMNIMLVSVQQRTREIGVEKALGAQKHHILFQFLAEALAITFAGGAAGIGIAYLISWCVGALPLMSAFGDNLPDGIVPLDDIFAGDAIEPPALDRNGAAAGHIAVVTFDVTHVGIVPAARSHAALIAGGLGVHLEACIEMDASLIGALALPSFAGLATTLVPWLLCGGTLALHHPFAPATLAAQRTVLPDAITVLPGALVARLADSGLLGEAPVLAVWRAPERLSASAPWTGAAPLIDVAVFGETGLIAHSPEECRTLLNVLIGSPELRADLGRNAARDVAAIRTPARSAQAFVALWRALAAEAPRRPDFKTALGDTPADWFLATQRLPGDAWSPSIVPEPRESKGTLAHFESVFADDASL